MGFTEIFAKNFRQHFNGMFPNLPPFHLIEIGDFGELKNHYFQKLGNIRTSFGINFSTEESILQGSESFNTNSTIDFSAKGECKFDSIADTCMMIKFSKDNSVYFNTVLSSFVEIKDPIATIQQDIISLYKSGVWKKQYVLISSIEKSKNTILAISANSEAEVILGCNCDFLNSNDMVKVDASIGLDVKKKTNGSYVYVNSTVGDIVPRFRLIRLEGLFSKSMTILSGDTISMNTRLDEDNTNNEYDDDIEYQLNKLE